MGPSDRFGLHHDCGDNGENAIHGASRDPSARAKGEKAAAIRSATKAISALFIFRLVRILQRGWSCDSRFLSRPTGAGS
jgi:hypothetical protein